ncbi:MAG TPA: hypothetical protein VN428_22395 [Bryobacteraceae bacterium]|nr:hypothetical protein [Bryobacteraceae bacterium]
MSPAAHPWRNPRIALTLFLVFLAGFSAGLAVFSLGAQRWMRGAEAAPQWRDTGDPGRQALLNRFKSELSLTPDQTRQLESVLDDYFTYYHTLQAQLDDVRASGRDRILRLLDNGQKRRFEQLMDEVQKHKQLR